MRKLLTPIIATVSMLALGLSLWATIGLHSEPTSSGLIVGDNNATGVVKQITVRNGRVVAPVVTGLVTPNDIDNSGYLPSGTYGSSSSATVVTTDGSGRITSASTLPIAITPGNLGSANANSVVAGPATGPAGAITTRSLVSADLPTVLPTPAGTNGSALRIPIVTTDTFGRTTAASSVYHTAPNALNPRNPNQANGAVGTIGGVFDGNSHPLSNYFATLAAAQAAFPNIYIWSLTNCELDRVALQNALNIAGTNGNVYVPGPFLVDFPLVVANSNVQLFGDGPTQTIIGNSPLITGTPGILVCSSGMDPVPIGPALGTGAGGSFTLNGSSNSWLNLSDMGYQRIWGGTTLTVDFYLKLNSLPVGNNTYNSIFSFCGALSSVGDGDGLVNSLSFGVITQGGQSFFQTTCTTGTLPGTLTPTTFQTSAIPPASVGTTQHVALVLTGGTLTIYVAGQSVGSANVGAGGITSVPYLDFTIGPQNNTWPDYENKFVAANGYIDSFRISGNARWTTNFNPPTAKPTSDAQTAALINFDLVGPQGIPMVGVYNGASKKISWVFWRESSFGGAISQTTIRDLQVSLSIGTGIVGIASTNTTIRNVNTSACTFGVYMWLNCFSSVVQRCQLNGFTAAIVQSSNCANTTVRDCRLQTGGNGIAAVSAFGGSRFVNIYLLQSYIHFLVTNCISTTTRFDDIYIDVEASPYALYSFYFFNNLATCINSAFVANPGPNPSVGCNSKFLKGPLTIKNSYFNLDGASPPSYVFKVINTPQLLPIVIENTQNSLLLPWANNMDYVRILEVEGTPLVHLVPTAGVVTLNVALGNSFQAALGNGAQSVTLSNPTVGQKFTLDMQQPTSGAAGTVSSWFSGYTVRPKGGGSMPSLTATNGAIDRFQFEIYNSTTLLATPNLNY